MQYEEKQHLKLWWLYVLLGVETIIVSSILFLHHGLTFNALKAAYFLPVFAILLPYLIVYLVNQNAFTFCINEKEISYHYWPFAKRKTIAWEEIDQAYLRKYDALGEYGGWGFRYQLWFKWKDKAYIFNDGQTGLQLHLKNGTKILFSTQNLTDLDLFLIDLGRTHHLKAIATDVR
jgi:hypothetical protein